MSEDVSLRRQRLTESLDLLEGAYSRYLAAPPADRKQLNNALLSHILIGPSPDDTCVVLLPEIGELVSRVGADEVFV